MQLSCRPYAIRFHLAKMAEHASLCITWKPPQDEGPVYILGQLDGRVDDAFQFWHDRLSSGFCAGGPPVSEYVVQVKSVDKTQQVRRPQLQTLTPVLLAVGLWTSKAQVQEISIASSPAWISGLFGNSCYRHLLARRPDLLKQKVGDWSHQTLVLAVG